MILPDDAGFLTDLILQRTRPFIELGGKPALREWTTTGRTDHLLPFLAEQAAVIRYTDAALAEIRADAYDYAMLIGNRSPRRIVSVGAGNGIAEAILCKHYRPEAILLVDIEQGGSGHGFKADAAGYASLQRAASLMRDNGVTCRIEVWNPTKEPAPAFGFDLLFSMYAMGFHFPVSHYAELIKANAQADALLVYDARDAKGAMTRIARRAA